MLVTRHPGAHARRVTPQPSDLALSTTRIRDVERQDRRAVPGEHHLLGRLTA